MARHEPDDHETILDASLRPNYPLPEHLATVAEHWFSYLDNHTTFVHLARQGISAVGVTAELMERTYELDRSRVDRDRMHYAQKLKRLGERDSTRGYPLLHAHALMALWGGLEAFIDDWFLAHLRQNPDILKSERFEKVKLPVKSMVGDRLNLEEAVLIEVKRQGSAELRQGINRFEAILEYIDRTAPVSKRVKDGIFRAQQIRNVWAHRGGKVDRRFCEKLPQMQLRVGSVIELDSRQYGELSVIVGDYSGLVIERELSSLPRAAEVE